MAKRKFAVADSAIGALVCLLVLAAFWMHWADGIELKLYDLRAKLRATDRAPEQIILVGIDDQSLNEIGRWPWPRSYIADMIDLLSESQAKVIALNILFDRKELNPGLAEVSALRQAMEEQAQQMARGVRPPADDPDAAVRFAAQRASAATVADVARILQQVEQKLDNDARLVDAIALSANVVLPMHFHLGRAMGKSDKAIPEPVQANFLPEVPVSGREVGAVDFVAPYAEFAEHARALGQINLTPSPDGVQRSYPLVVSYNGRLFPSFALQMLRAFYNLESEDYRYTPGRELVLGNARIPVDAEGRLLVNYIGPPYQTFTSVRFSDVRNRQIPMELFQDKIVIIGLVATGVGADLYSTPVGTLYPAAELHATVMQNVLSESFLLRPEWAQQAELIVLIVLALFVALAIPHLSAGKSAIIASLLLIAVIAGGIYMFTAYGYWLQMVYPVLMLVAGYSVVVSKRYLVAEKRTEVLEGESVETNKMLGLSFQGQGMLDMAFEKFRKCPVDDSMKDILYNLALDFERKRQFNKAVSVFDHIAAVDKNFRDIATRSQKLRVAGETVIFGGARRAGSDSTVLMEGGVGDLAKPTLGRYEVLRELGKGAMGTVYLGKDPKINREVAIKTLRFEEEFDAADAKAMKERFFREAESAGRLVHPNIVTIYDAGDDGDISYIAMELLSGTDLKDFTEKEKLLPVPEVLGAIAKVADALDYAHGQGVVHRDIKPANIMRLKDGAIKVTDFGIARITSQSKTATGTVMGTPSYMAPEQLAGHKVDGRADLFSLGVTLYELLSGEKPFTGDSIATLMFRIANQPHPPVRQARADLPDGCEAIIDKALEKDPERRYQRGSELASDLRALLARSPAAGA
jgi:CHASE2 domain-containing sensor protein/tRNA A-37 threonylcarbamoyl transferase component Bud32